MHKTLPQWVDVLSRSALPILAVSHQRLSALRQSDADVSGAQIATLIASDPMLLLGLMRMANSGRSSRFAQPVTTVEHAVMMLGLSPSIDNMLTMPVLEQTLGPAAQAGLLGTVTRTFHAASQARDWAMLRLDTNVEEMYNATLLQELAEMALWVVAPAEMQTVLHVRSQQGAENAEQQVLGCAVDVLTLALAQEWNLPPLIASALRPADCETHPRARLVSLARRVARHSEQGWYGADLTRDIDSLAATLRISPDEAATRVHRTAVGAARARVYAAVPPAATWLPMLPGEWQEPVAASSSDPFQAVMARLAAHMDGSLNLDGLMLLVLKGMREGIGLKRAVFAWLSEDKQQLHARYVIGAQQGDPLAKFDVDLSRPSLFSKMLVRQQAFWLNDAVRAKVGELIDGEVQRMTKATQFFLMTVAVHGEVVGMFYADAGAGELDAASYDKFKQLCAQASLAMGRGVQS